jgi:hypothetical protein
MVNQLVNFGLGSYQATLKPLLTPDNIKKRVEFCRKYENWSFLQWQQVIFSDESNYQLVNRQNIPVVRHMIQEKYVYIYIFFYLYGLKFCWEFFLTSKPINSLTVTVYYTALNVNTSYY